MAKKKGKEFKLVVGAETQGFCQCVNVAAAEGWGPVGGVSASPGFKGTVFALLMERAI